MKYTIDYFIEKFEAIPEEKWCRHSYHNGDGQSCALGHCGCRQYVPLTEKALELITLFGWLKTNNEGVSSINDGLFGTNVFGNTPKERILAALREIKNDFNLAR